MSDGSVARSSKDLHERWLAETWRMIEDCAKDNSDGHRVSLSAKGCAALLAERRVTVTPEPPRQLELTNELRWILGRPCFMVIPMVQCLRKMGRHIDTKAEDEQAVAIHWMLSLYLEHGADKWRDEAEKILKEGQRQAIELKTSEQSP